MKRKRYKKEFQARVALEAIQGEKTISKIASDNRIHPNLVSKWRKKALAGLVSIFETNAEKKTQSDFSEEELLQHIGRLQVELEFLKKKSTLMM